MTTAITMTRAERIVALSLAIEALKQEQRVSDWMKANPGSTCWVTQERAHCVCVIVNGGKVIAENKGATPEDARAHAFSVVFLREDEVSA